MPDEAGALRELLDAYRNLVKVSRERLSAEQSDYLRQVEYKLIAAMLKLPRNRFERQSVRSYIEKLMRRELDDGL